MDEKPQKGHAPFETPMVLCCFVRWGRSRPWAWRGHIDGVSHLWGVPAPLAGFPSIARASSLVACGRFPAAEGRTHQKKKTKRSGLVCWVVIDLNSNKLYLSFQFVGVTYGMKGSTGFAAIVDCDDTLRRFYHVSVALHKTRWYILLTCYIHTVTCL